MPLPDGHRIFMAPSSSEPAPAELLRADPLHRRPVRPVLPTERLDLVRVDVVYALPPGAARADAATSGGLPIAVAHPVVVTVELAPGATVRDAVLASGLLQHLPGVAVDALDLGVFNRAARPERLLEPGDRVEIYRPLQIDPKAARHLRVAARRKAEARARQGAAGAAPSVPVEGGAATAGSAASGAGSDPTG